MGLAHGEGLPGQSAVEDDGGEELVLGHGRQQEADAVGLADQALHHVLAVDIVDLAAVFFQVLVQEGLQGADFQLGSGVGNGDHALLAAGQNVGDLMALALAVVSAGVGGQIQ